MINTFIRAPKPTNTVASFQRKLEPRPYSLGSFCRNFVDLFQDTPKSTKGQETLQSYQKVLSLKVLGSSFRWNDADFGDCLRCHKYIVDDGVIVS